VFYNTGKVGWLVGSAWGEEHPSSFTSLQFSSWEPSGALWEGDMGAYWLPPITWKIQWTLDIFLW
jgi:hypothetical protein